ncbi:amidohydrolase family protein [Jatrophihabitans sp.]|uniref:amidohydrolase family protein n=1 Tax=Jatrophihabitans sp. TaxID=1932789 RepID=UPI0030C73ED3|nr:amidohydrolase [Jatrophihabitans sp.]
MPDEPVRIDADVHAPRPSVTDLTPHLEPHWPEYLKWTGFRPKAGERLYPEWTGLSTGTASEAANASFRATLDTQVFDRCALAVVSTYFGVESVLHPYLAPDLASAVNRWLATEYLDTDDRLRGSAMVAPQFADSAAAEVARVATDSRFVQIQVPARSMEPYGNHRYWDLWEAVSSHDLTVGITYGGSVTIPGNAINWMDTFFEQYSAGTQPFATHITSLVLNGVFERWPNLRFAFVDTGWTWLPGLLWRLDKEWKEGRQEVPWVRRPPSEYVAEHMRFTTTPTDAPTDPRHLQLILRQLPCADMLMYSSDLPRAGGSGIEAITAGLTVEEQDRVLGGNAAQLYRLTRERVPS